MFSRHFKTQDNTFQASNKAKTEFLNGIKKSKQANLNPFIYYYIIYFPMKCMHSSFMSILYSLLRH